VTSNGPVVEREAGAADGRVRIVAFEVDGERFAVRASAVEEALDGITLARMPAMPPHFAGVVQHRQAVLPALDPAPVLGLAGTGPRSSALVVRRGRLRYALLVDRLEGVRTIEEVHDVLGDPGAGSLAGRSAGPELLTDDEGLITLLRPGDLFAGALPAGWEEDAMTVQETSAPPSSVVVFRLGGTELGIDVLQVQEVLPYSEPLPVPRAPAFVEGVLELRGTIVPVIDLRTRFELEKTPPGPDTRVLVVTLGEDRIGLIVDAVTDVLHLSPDQITPPPAYFRGLSAEYLEGIVRQDGKLRILLRIDRILTSEERLALLGADLEPVPAGTAGRARKGRGRREKKDRTGE
jgi:purine-binding chemotaxis protein CheW